MTVPLYSLTDTWNAGATVFTALQMNITGTAYAANSELMSLQIGGNEFFAVLSKAANSSTNTDAILKLGNQTYMGTVFNSDLVIGSGGTFSTQSTFYFQNGVGLQTLSNYYYGWTNSTSNATTTVDVALFRDASAILAQRNGVNAQTLRVYNTFTDASNYERGVFDWTTTANTLTIGMQNAGTGSARGMVLSVANTASIDLSPGAPIVRITGSGGNNGMDIGAHAIYGSASGIGFGGSGISFSGAATLAIGNGSAGDSSGTILAKTKAGAPTTSDVPASTWALIRDTTNNTTKVYYNNAGTLQSAALT